MLCFYVTGWRRRGGSELIAIACTAWLYLTRKSYKASCSRKASFYGLIHYRSVIVNCLLFTSAGFSKLVLSNVTGGRALTIWQDDICVQFPFLRWYIPAAHHFPLCHKESNKSEVLMEARRGKKTETGPASGFLSPPSAGYIRTPLPPRSAPPNKKWSSFNAGRD